MIIGLAWLLLRFKMSDHENLQAYGTIIFVWGLLFFGILAIPEYVHYPLNAYLCAIDTVGIIVFSIIYFGYVKRPKSLQPEPQREVAESQQSESLSHIANVEKLKTLSPIHTMIMAIERVSPREASFGPGTGIGIGRLVPLNTPNLNLDKVRSIFSEYASVLGNHHLNKWLKFDEQISESTRNAFWVGKSEWKWFDELEREYQEVVNASLTQTTPETVVKLATSQPELTIPISELKPTGEVKEIEVRFPNGDIRRNRVCFYYVTVRAKGQRTIENVFASLDGTPLNIAPRTEKPSFGVDYTRFSAKRFDEHGTLEFVYALLREQRKVKDRIRYLHPGPGQDFVLFFGVEGLNDFYIFSGTYLWYDPRRGFCGSYRDDGTGTVKLRLYLEGQDAKGCNMMFKVNFLKWDSFSVTPVELSQ
jgi:hypothetical protein